MGWLFIIYILCLLPIILYGITWILMRRARDRSVYMKTLPGPKPFLWFGNYFDFIGGTEVILNSLLKYLKTYGDILLAYNGTLNWGIIQTDYEFTELLLSSSIQIEKAEQYEYLHSWLGQGLLTSTGSKWRAHRKAITPAFHFSILQEFIGVFDNVGDDLVKKLQKEVGKDSVEISQIVSKYALDVICEAAMGVKVNALERESTYIKNIKIMCSIVMERMFSPINNRFYPLTWKYYKEKKAVKVIHNYVDDVINKRIIEFEKRKNNSNETENTKDDYGVKKRMAFLDLLLKTTINGQPLSREDLRDEVNTFMFEGHDTTATAITFCLLEIARNPGVQEKVIKEQEGIFGNDLKNARPTYTQLNEMKYLDLVIKETLRLYPPVPYFGRKLVSDLEFKGNIYPKGICIMIFPFAFQRYSKYFPEPEKFIPERFEEQNKRLPFSYTPFSAGPRNCIGQKFAMLEMLSTVSKVIRNFELGPAVPEHHIRLAAESILVSKNGIRVSIKNRQ